MVGPVINYLHVRKAHLLTEHLKSVAARDLAVSALMDITNSAAKECSSSSSVSSSSDSLESLVCHEVLSDDDDDDTTIKTGRIQYTIDDAGSLHRETPNDNIFGEEVITPPPTADYDDDDNTTTTDTDEEIVKPRRRNRTYLTNRLRIYKCQHDCGCYTSGWRCKEQPRVLSIHGLLRHIRCKLSHPQCDEHCKNHHQLRAAVAKDHSNPFDC